MLWLRLACVCVFAGFCDDSFGYGAHVVGAFSLRKHFLLGRHGGLEELWAIPIFGAHRGTVEANTHLQ